MQYHVILNTLSSPIVFMTIGFLAFVLFSKTNIILKLLTLFCAVYVNLLVFYGEALEQLLGNGQQLISQVCFTFAALAFLFSFFKFIKASVNIICWLMIALIAGSVAFPNFVEQKFPQNQSAGNYLGNDKIAIMMDHLKTGFFSKSFE